MSQIVPSNRLTILQILPALISGGVERGTIDMAAHIVSLGHVALVASAGGPMVHELERCGAKHIPLPLQSKNPFAIFRNAKDLRKIIRKYNVDIVHARSRAPAWAAYRAVRGTSAHLVTSFHGRYNFKGKLKRWYNSVMTRGERVIAVSHFIKNHIAQNYRAESSVIDVVPRGIDLSRFDPAKVLRDRMVKLAQEWNLPDDKPIIMLPARITRWKGQAELIEALAHLKRDFFCLLIGSSHGHEAFQKKLEARIIQSGLGGKIRLTSECKDMPAAYLLADVVVSASTEPEAFGRVVVEAQAMGRPVVATAHGGAIETVLDGQTGILVAPGDADAMAQAIEKILDLNTQARESLAALARDHVVKNFSKEAMCQGEFDVYRKVLNQPSRVAKAA